MIHGVLNVYKEKGYKSHDVVAKLRGITGQKKIGHTGTLDPDATGVLPVCLGKATKLCDMLTDKDKTYEAVLLRGVSTDTQDAGGEVLGTSDTAGLGEKEVREAIQSFVGGYDQVPPMYSALKVGGKRLYELAREGKVVERKARPVDIYQIRVLKMDLPRVWMEVSCSKGTYIRTLCHDIGEKLGCGGCMEELFRTKVSSFLLSDSLTLADINKRMQEGTLGEVLVPVDAMFGGYRKIVVKEPWISLARNGNSLPIKAVTGGEGIEDGEEVRLYNEAGQFIAIYAWKEERKEYHIVKMFFNEYI